MPHLKPLYKMILSDRVALSWLPDEFASDEEMVAAVNGMHSMLQDTLTGNNGDNLRSLLQHIGEHDLGHIYITNGPALTDIAQQQFARFDVYTAGIKAELRNSIKPTPKEKREPELLDERINKLFKQAGSFSIAYLDSLGEAHRAVTDDADKEGRPQTIEEYFSLMDACNWGGEQRVNLFTRIEMAYNAAADVLSGKVANIGQSNDATALVKDLLDCYKDLQRFIKPLLGSGDEADKDSTFDAKLNEAWNALDIVTPLYNKVRNWLSRKPYSTEKIKLNFKNSTLMNGWDVNKEPDNTAVLLRKDGMYYVAIMNKRYNRAFDTDKLPCEGECYDKVDYKLLPGANKMLPKVFIASKKGRETYAPSKALLDAYNLGTHKKGEHFSLADCHRLIDFFKQCIARHEDWKNFPFHFSPTETYEDISDFYREVEQQGYMLNFRKVSADFINRLVDEGKLYLFQIWNKDFSAYSKGTPNMHTLYWKMLFDERNLADVVYKLSGGAEVFYRKKSLALENTTIHAAHQPIKNKNGLNPKKTSTFDYALVKDRRYTVDKFQLHVPITMNFKATGHENINNDVLDIIRSGGIRHIIGIDRGERHLLYLSLIDLKGNIVKQMTLNDIRDAYQGKEHVTNYHDLLAAREGERDEARRNWGTLQNIKDVKQGYLSQVVHVISRMMVEYDAIVVLEDLNGGFMRGRQKIERSVYEQFEKMLIDKLCYLVDKRQSPTATGGLLHALQLASKFESFKKLGKQSGCLFYIPAWNTSKIDPVTGFVNLFDTRFVSEESSRKFFGNFRSIRYNAEKDRFEFSFDYSDFTDKAKDTRTRWTLCTCQVIKTNILAKDTRTRWTLCTVGSRIRTFRNKDKNLQWDNVTIENLTDEFKRTFAAAGIDIHGNLKEAICSLRGKRFFGFTGHDAETEHPEFYPLMPLMKLLLQMRNSMTGTDVDYLLSPVADEEGRFFNSHDHSGDNAALPKDADANGAYNIARKGLWAVRQIQATKSGERPNLAISNREWLRFAQQKPYLDD